MQAAGLEPNMGVAYFEYDFAKHGGTIGDITVYGSGIPSGAIIHTGLIYTKTAPVGASATIALKALTANDIKAATAITSFTINSIQATVPVATAATSIRMTSQINAITVTIATTNLTAGKFVVALCYWPPVE